MIEKISTRVFALCFLFLLSQCAEKAILVNPSFIGVWSAMNNGITYQLSIDQHSNAFWVKDNNGHYEYAQGVARINGNEMRVGIKKFEINEYPVQDTATKTWVMILDGINYMR